MPSIEHEQQLREDYEQMREMYHEEPLPFDTIKARLAELERTVAHHVYFRQRES